MTETLTETQEERLRENGYFLYQGFHFKPIRQFTEKDGDFFEKTRRLRGFMQRPRIRKRIFSSALRQ